MKISISTLRMNSKFTSVIFEKWCRFISSTVLLVNCTTYYYRIFEVDTGRHPTHIFLFLMLCVNFKIVIWPLFVHVKSESSGVPSLSEYVIIFLKIFSSDSKIFHGNPSPLKSHVNYI